MGKIYLKTDYTDCPYITAGKLYEARAAQTVKYDGVKNDAYYITCDEGIEIYAFIGAPIPHLNNIGEFYLCKQEPEHVRPIMTTEARDILDSIHETIGAETRSESIIKFVEKNTELGVELCAAKVQPSTLEEQSRRRIESLENDAESLEGSRIELLKGYSNIAKELDIEKSKRKGWMIYSAIVAVYAIGVSIYCLIGG
ncbi:hypothetical protein [Shewanella chilikensis]|uniref:hypothetical protein n=1 Tax=Shewanella chilikensis TaxID=558541 RepID=UPI003A971AC6